MVRLQRQMFRFSFCAIVERVRACIQRNPQKSTRLASLAFQPSKTNVSEVLRKRLLATVQTSTGPGAAFRRCCRETRIQRTESSQGGRSYQVSHNTIYSTTITEPTQTAPIMDRRQTIHMELPKTKWTYHTSHTEEYTWIPQKNSISTISANRI